MQSSATKGSERGFKKDAEQSERMAAEISDRVREIADARGLPESEVFEEALERGIDDLWTDIVLSRYFDGDLSRDETRELVGRTTLERAERERDIVSDDIDWGLNA